MNISKLSHPIDLALQYTELLRVHVLHTEKKQARTTIIVNNEWTPASKSDKWTQIDKDGTSNNTSKNCYLRMTSEIFQFPIKEILHVLSK